MRLTKEYRDRILGSVADAWDNKNPNLLDEVRDTFKAGTDEEYLARYAKYQANYKEQTDERHRYLRDVAALLSTFNTFEDLEREWPEIMRFTSGIPMKPSQIQLVY